MEEEVLQLGGNIELSGFSSLDGGVMIVLKKIVGNYAKKMSEKVSNFEKLSLTMKLVHAKEKSEKYEIHGKMVDNGKAFTSTITERNLFVGVDSVLKGIIGQIKP